MPKRVAVTAVALFAVHLMACAGSARRMVADPIRLEAVHCGPRATGRSGVADAPGSRRGTGRGCITPTDGAPRVVIRTARQLFEAGGRHLGAKRYAAALGHYDRLLSEFRASSFVVAALYNAGLAHERLGQLDRAARRYRRLLRLDKVPARDAIDARFRLAAAFEALRSYSSAAREYQAQLRVDGLRADERVEAHARQGLCNFRLKDYRRARRAFREALSAARLAKRVSGADEDLEGDFFMGMARYYSAAIPHMQFRNARLSAGMAMGPELEVKAQLLLQAQSRYLATVRGKNTYWATAAGFQVGSLYRELYAALMTVLPNFSKVAAKEAQRSKISPAVARKQAITAYLAALHKRIRPLLHQAIHVFELNLLRAERIGQRGAWVDKSRYQVQLLKNLLAATPEEAIRMIPRITPPPEDQQGRQPTDPAPASVPAGPTIL